MLRYVNRQDIPLIEQAAIAHAQFETIHPIPGGNGRVGRALMDAMLRNKGSPARRSCPSPPACWSASWHSIRRSTTFELETQRRSSDVPRGGILGNSERAMARRRTGEGSGQLVGSGEGAAGLDDLAGGRPVGSWSGAQYLGSRRGNGHPKCPRFAVPRAARECGSCHQVQRVPAWGHWHADEILAMIDEFVARSRRPQPLR
ncbi:Fic family protein [Nakamurella lactea]|uniref:Fic family protein n=1 Tax=Nakamurella lactea TaxID=459515 RepID=UPI0009FEEB51